MLLSQDLSHPYWYARIVGIFHAMVVKTGPKSKSREPMKMEFLFVRWFGLDEEEIGGWKAKKLHQIGFVEGDAAFGFVDPADVIRAIHLIPRFAQGRTKDMLGPSIARSPLDKDEDWIRYYINMYVSYFIFVSPVLTYPGQVRRSRYVHALSWRRHRSHVNPSRDGGFQD
jgi:hypothetical protein